MASCAGRLVAGAVISGCRYQRSSVTCRRNSRSSGFERFVFPHLGQYHGVRFSGERLVSACCSLGGDSSPAARGRTLWASGASEWQRRHVGGSVGMDPSARAGGEAAGVDPCGWCAAWAGASAKQQMAGAETVRPPGKGQVCGPISLQRREQLLVRGRGRIGRANGVEVFENIRAGHRGHR